MNFGEVVDYGLTLSARWADILDPQEPIEEEIDNRSCEEIVHGIWDRMRSNDDSI